MAATKRPSIKEVVRRAQKAGYNAEFIMDEHRLAAAIKKVRPRLKITTAYKIAAEIRAQIFNGS